MKKLLENYLDFIKKGGVYLIGLKFKWLFLYPLIWLLYSFVKMDLTAMFFDLFFTLKTESGRISFLTLYVIINFGYYMFVSMFYTLHTNNEDIELKAKAIEIEMLENKLRIKEIREQLKKSQDYSLLLKKHHDNKENN